MPSTERDDPSRRSNRLLEKKNQIARAVYVQIEKFVEREYPTAKAELLLNLEFASLSNLMRALSKSQEIDRNGRGGGNRRLTIAVMTIKELFSGIDEEVKASLGFTGKTKEDISDFDLMEIGLCDCVDTHEKMIAQIATRNLNLVRIFSADNNPYDGVAERSLPDEIYDHLHGEMPKFSQRELYQAPILFKWPSYESELIDINTLQLEKIQNAIQVNTKAAIFGGDSPEEKELKTTYFDMINGLSGDSIHKLTCIILEIAKDLMRSKQTEELIIAIFKNIGIVDSLGNILVVHSQTKLKERAKISASHDTMVCDQSLRNQGG